MTGVAGDPRSAAASARRLGKRLSWGELGPRLGSAAVMMAAALLTTVWGGILFGLFWFAAALIILREWQALVGGPRGALPLSAGGLALGASAVLAGASHLVGALASLVLGALALAALASPARRTMAAAGILYAGVPLVALVVLRHATPFGTLAIFWLFAVVWGTDVMAFFGGRTIGGPKLSPRFSPSKTWSGFLIGILSGGLLGLLVVPSVADKPRLLVLGLVAGALAQAGDLFESALKRRFGVKDSSALIPGHGGLMDRLDGFAAAACFAACLGVVRHGVDAPGLGLFSW
ncbi:MAG TPA: phosphatidate cytidylyltransferase [Lichenihabitans sp.]|jgi:phosphatidate cytidylyltransferase|nr:phosphatidate cytidylyltransferase [Lichenihabitans sp.]